MSGKSNEILAIPELLAALRIKGFLVSIDSMGCQKLIAEQIVAQGGGNLLTVKGNQARSPQAVQDAFLDRQAEAPRHEGARNPTAGWSARSPRS